MFAGITVTDSKAYIWQECLDSILENLTPAMHLHCVFDKPHYKSWSGWIEASKPCASSWEVVDYGHQTLQIDEYSPAYFLAVSHVQQVLIQRFLESEHDYLWLLECDHVLLPDTLSRLLEQGKLMISALSPARWKPEIAMAHLPQSEPPVYAQMKTIPIDSLRFDSVLRVVQTGMGCLLVHRSLVEKADFSKPTRKGNDTSWLWSIYSRTGELPWLHCGALIEHADCQITPWKPDGTIVYHGIQQEEDGSLKPYSVGESSHG